MSIHATAAEIAEWERRGLEIIPAKRPAILVPVARCDPDYVCVTVGVQTRNPVNMLRHWRVHKREADEQKSATMLALMGVTDQTWSHLAQGCIVTFTRISAGALDDDSLPATIKHIRDIVAIKLFGGEIGKRDSDPRVVWDYKQIRGPQKIYGVIISIRRTQKVKR